MIIDTGIYRFSVADYPQQMQTALCQNYGDCPESSEFFDFEISLKPGKGLRRFLKPQVRFLSDQHAPFKPLPMSQAYALLEWGMNWCIATHEYSRLIIHAAVLVKNNKGIIFPAAPGSGKSTLSGVLSQKGWTLYSDEMAIIEHDSLQAQPIYRPVCLKNNSIDLVQSMFPHCEMTERCKDTQKGDVAHLKSITWDVFKDLQATPITAVVFPKYVANSETRIFQLDQANAFEKLIKQSFNYNVLGEQGFDTLSRMIGNTQLFEIEYSDLDDVDDFLTHDVL